MTKEPYPYPTYKPSGVEWLGDVPAHWEVRKLKTISSRIQNGSTPSTREPGYYSINGIPWYGPSSLGSNTIISQPIGHLSLRALKEGQARTIKPPALAVSVIGNVGKCALLIHEGVTNQQITCFELITDLCAPYFVAKQFGLAEHNLVASASSATIPILDSTVLKATKLALPPLDEQRTIVWYLDYVDRRIRRYVAAKRKLIALLEEEKQAIVNRAVTRGLDPNVRLKPSGVEWLGDVPEHWETMRARFLFKEVDNRSTSGKETHLSMSQTLGLVPSHLVERSLISDSYVGGKLCQEGDLVLNRLKAHLGVFALAKQAGVISPDYSVFRKRDSVKMEYFFRVLRLPALRTELRIRAKGIVEGFWRLYTDDFFDIRLPVPPYVEQQAIVEYVDSTTIEVDAAITRARRQIELVQEYRTRLIADVVTGKLDVREAAAHLPEEGGEADPIDGNGLVEDNIADNLYDASELDEELATETEVSV